jgi:triosephosphate isomerase
MTRKKIIAGNWKMNATKEEAVTLVNGILANYSDYNLSENKVAVVASPFPYIHYCSSMFSEFPYLLLRLRIAANLNKVHIQVKCLLK